MQILTVSGLQKTYTTRFGSSKVQALKNVNFTVESGEYVAIMGESGSGKTTLLNILAALDKPTGGEVVLDGRALGTIPEREIAAFRRSQLGFVFQEFNLLDTFSVQDNIFLPLVLAGKAYPEMAARLAPIARQLGIAELLQKFPYELSGGQKQRVAVARALITQPKLVLADEPTGALDSDTSIQVMDLLQEVAKERLVVMVTHNPELAELYANRIVTLRDGVICSDTNPFEPDSETLLPPKHKNMGKSSMSFLTALSLSFNNLRTKKARTLLTSFAGSIGIIGIALILALSSGVNEYIQNMEEETLSEYPLQIQSTGFALTSMMVGSQNAGKDSKDSGKKNEIKVQEVVTNMFSTMNSNDLASLKKYLHGGADGLGGLIVVDEPGAKAELGDAQAVFERISFV